MSDTPAAGSVPKSDKTASFGPFWLPVWTLTARELVRFFRQRTRIIGALGQPILFWILFGAGLQGSFQRPDWAPTHMTYQEYFFPGVAVMIVLFTAIFSTISIIEDRREGFLQGVLVAPIHPLALAFGKLTGGALLATLQAGLFLVLAPWAGLTLSLASGLQALAFLVLLAYGLTAVGFIIAWPLDSTQGFHAIMSMLLLPMWLLSGAFFPPPVSGWLSWIMRLNPLSYGVAGLRRLLYAGFDLPVTAAVPSWTACLVVTVAFVVVGIGVAAHMSQSLVMRDER